MFLCGAINPTEAAHMGFDYVPSAHCPHRVDNYV